MARDTISSRRNIYTPGGSTHKMFMYLVIRCGGCRTFTYVDRFQQWKLCANCGETIDVRRATVYLEVEDYNVAESVVAQLEEHLHRTKKKDLTREELETLRKQYAQWLRSGA
jgi:hypothetical protein